MGQKRLQFLCSHASRVALAVKQDEAADPGDILLLGPVAVVLQAQLGTHLIQQAGPLVHVGFTVSIIKVQKPRTCSKHKDMRSRRWGYSAQMQQLFASLMRSIFS